VIPHRAHARSSSLGTLQAYRADVAARGGQGALGECDGEWVSLGILLEHAGTMPAHEAASCLYEATNLLRSLLDAATWARGPRLDATPPGDDVPLRARVRCVAEDIESAGALRLADSLLAAYLTADRDMPAIEAARVEAQRARLAWKGGDLDSAVARYHRVERSALRLRSHELRLRALIGLAIVARLRGNYPLVRRLCQRAIRLADRASLPKFTSMAHHALLVATAVAGEFAAAVEHGWMSYVTAGGDPIMEAGVLGNIGQLFLDAGHADTAAAAFQAVIARRPPVRVLMPALGGLVVAAARCGQRHLVTQASEQLESLLTTAAQPYDITTALLDLARAYTAAGHAVRGAAMQQRALELARAHGYHELVHYAEQPLLTDTPREPEPRPLPPRVMHVAEAVRQLVMA
jgi:tetratricopeptide (TPR) repeat protein